MHYRDLIVKSRVKYYRKLAKLSQQKLAELAGCSDTMIQMIEYDQFVPNIKLAYSISMVLSDHLGYSVIITELFINYSNYY